MIISPGIMPDLIQLEKNHLQLEEASRQYYLGDGTVLMSDEEFDGLYQLTIQLERTIMNKILNVSQCMCQIFGRVKGDEYFSDVVRSVYGDLHDPPAIIRDIIELDKLQFDDTGISGFYNMNMKPINVYILGTLGMETHRHENKVNGAFRTDAFNFYRNIIGLRTPPME